ncbi:hypothetical protein Hanom_Chr17g01562111 [Helianthus anomalus]
MSVNRPATSHPYIILMGPPNMRPVLYNVVMPVITEMMENDTEKLASNLHMRLLKKKTLI